MSDPDEPWLAEQARTNPFYSLPFVWRVSVLFICVQLTQLAALAISAFITRLTDAGDPIADIASAFQIVDRGYVMLAAFTTYPVAAVAIACLHEWRWSPWLHAAWTLGSCLALPYIHPDAPSHPKFIFYGLIAAGMVTYAGFAAYRGITHPPPTP